MLEAGAFTLEQRLGGRRLTAVEQRVLVRSVRHLMEPCRSPWLWIVQVLEAVAELHAQRIVHGNLDPSHIVWFPTDFAWKLVNLDTASTIGDEVLLGHITSRRYVAPEIRRALVQQSKKIRLERASDMWAVGVMAFEVFAGIYLVFCHPPCRRARFPGASVVDPSGVKRHVMRELDRASRQGNGRLVERTVGQYPAKAHEQHVHELRSILALLKDDPTKRTTAAHALGEEETREASLENIGDIADVLKNVRRRLTTSLLYSFPRGCACSSLAWTGRRKAARSHWRNG